MYDDGKRLSFHGDGGTLFGIYLMSALLSMITLGIYSFWGRTKVRAYLWGQTEFDGDRFAYHGTGQELFIGWLKVVGVFFGLWLAMFGLIMALGEGGAIIVPLLFWGVIFALVPVAMIGARRYRLSRSSWRGVRFSLRAKTGDFVKLYLGGLALTVLTLGLYGPYFQTNVRKFLTEHAYLGTARFGFDGEGRELFPRYLRALLFTILTLGVYSFWWLAERERYFWSHTTFAGGRMRSTMTGGEFLGLSVVNLLIVVFTLGIGGAWVVVRTRRYLTECLTLDGAYDLSGITQDAMAASATGEGLADMLDVGGIDAGL